MNISDLITKSIQVMLADANGVAEIQRNELAGKMGCVPSQINYVIASRFTPEQGYLVESRRGGGGYIRIFRMEQDTSEHILHLLNDRIGDSIPALEASQLISQILERGLVTQGEASLILAAVNPQAMSLPISAAMKDALRAKILKNILLEIARKTD